MTWFYQLSPKVDKFLLLSDYFWGDKWHFGSHLFSMHSSVFDVCTPLFEDENYLFPMTAMRVIKWAPTNIFLPQAGAVRARASRSKCIHLQSSAGMYSPIPSTRILVGYTYSKSNQKRHGNFIGSSELTFQLNGTLCWVLVPYDFPLFVLHTISKIDFHLWCMIF